MGDSVIKIVEYAKARADIHLVRDTVFIKEQGISRELEYDGLDPGSYHVLVWDEVGHIGRLAVLKDQRRKGIGGSILRALIAKARELGMKKVDLNAQRHAVSFYKKLGFEEKGHPFYEANIPHLRMIKCLRRESTSSG
jgi:predicted GNAT family N-acyltransferase